jgi:hypothetical protein
MTLVNLTPHALTVLGDDGSVVTLEPSGQVARVSATATQVGTVSVDGMTIPVVRTVFDTVTGLPDPVPGVVYVASTMVAQAAAAAGRTDVVSPDTGPTAVRGEDGQIKAVRRFQTFAASWGA